MGGKIACLRITGHSGKTQNGTGGLLYFSLDLALAKSFLSLVQQNIVHRALWSSLDTSIPLEEGWRLWTSIHHMSVCERLENKL